ncbi:MAG: response regulator, partial [candidate division KSB1 bacterium]|nr:response regulator [candidate division KSB1 bacterium]
MRNNHPTKILVVEDESIVAKHIQTSLERLGYVVPVVASSGEDAIENAALVQPDLVLMDVKLKGMMDGIEAAEKILHQLDVPIVYLTAYADDDTLKRAKITEPYGYILKPFQERELHTTIEMAINKHKVERKLKAREQFEKLIATLSTQFINLAPDEIDAAINRALQAIGEFIGVDRSYIFQFSEDGSKLINTHLWCA